jgi:glycosyltransferase involved in cell wall biosynthesis
MSDLPVLWAGQFTDPTGYGEEARAFMLACERAGTPIAVEDWPAFKTQLEVTEEQEAVFARAAARVPAEPYVNVWHKMPLITMKAVLSGVGPTVMRTMFETDSIPKKWLPGLERVDEVWVPSRFNVETFERGGVPVDKLKLLPQTLDFALYDPERTIPLPAPARARAFCFLSVFEFSARKGWDILLDAWAQAFDPDEDVCLILKASRNLRTSAAASEKLDAYLAGRSCAPIVYETRTLASKDMPRLYAMCDAYVGPSRGEGWGRPYMEAMAMGLPTIASRWSGNLEFTTDDNSFLLDGEVVPVPDDEVYELFHGQHWFEPDRDQLAQLMRQIYNEGSEVKARAARARPSLLAGFGEEKTAARIAALAAGALEHWAG